MKDIPVNVINKNEEIQCRCSISDNGYAIYNPINTNCQSFCSKLSLEDLLTIAIGNVKTLPINILVKLYKEGSGDSEIKNDEISNFDDYDFKDILTESQDMQRIRLCKEIYTNLENLKSEIKNKVIKKLGEKCEDYDNLGNIKYVIFTHDGKKGNVDYITSNAICIEMDENDKKNTHISFYNPKEFICKLNNADNVVLHGNKNIKDVPVEIFESMVSPIS